MNGAHIHLLINHLPIAGTIIGLLVLLAGYLLKSFTVRRTALGIFLFAALLTVPSYLSGEGAEEVVEEMAGVSHDLIEEHEDLGKIFLILMGVLGLASAVTLFADLRKTGPKNNLYFLVLVISVVCIVMAAQVGLSGGSIMHSEIRNNAAQPTENPEPGR
ncbi:hypothetical protein [Pontibacter vulgaris]|uniref:hypothetical protein n=1 Tax=Pontibacter vulgaris TaxID=2905679 RepID=UPI001FA8071D|nr:hypothetical protein [Pontibacter vulgaris]